MPGVTPTCLALVLCDRVGRVRQSGRASLIGVFQAMTSRFFPMTTKPFSAWMQLYQVNGLVRMRLVIERQLPDVLGCEVIVVVPFTLHCSDPNEVLEHVIDFRNGIGLPCTGAYQARLMAGDVTIMTRPFVAVAGAGE